jgi:arylsulfatase A-like enzyme
MRKPFATLASCVALLCLAAPLPCPAAERPNIVFLLTDDQRADALGCYGNTIIQTPHIDSLAARGARFTNAFVTTSICMTSRASIMLGQYAARHGVNDFSTPLTAEQLGDSYFGRLKAAGYRLGFAGKWGVGQPPNEFFDFGRGYPGQGWYYDPDDPDRPHMTEHLGNQAIEFLETCDGERPFCLSVSFKAPHVQDQDRQQPFRYETRLESLYADVAIGDVPLMSPRHFEALPGFLRASENRARWEVRFATPELYQRSVKGYYRLITGVDQQVGRILAKLAEIGAAENTIVIYSSDNGFFLGERGWAGKWYAHDVSIRVPLIVYNPHLPRERQGATRDEMALNIDIGPTILDLAGVEAPGVMQGRSLAPLLRGEAAGDWRDEFFYEHHFEHPRIPRSEGVRTRRWKYIRYLDSEPMYEELYDLQDDPDEEHNLARDDARQEELDNMRSRLQVLRAAAK